MVVIQKGNVSNAASKYLYIPATSALSERVFSVSGYVLNQKRSRLSGKHLDALIFLKLNKFIE
jgi:hypothetical protein